MQIRKSNLHTRKGTHNTGARVCKLACRPCRLWFRTVPLERNPLLGDGYVSKTERDRTTMLCNNYVYWKLEDFDKTDET